MNRLSFSRATFTQTPRPSAEEIVQRVAEKAGVSTGTVRVFARISAPENKHLFTAGAAQKAFAHVKVNS